MVLKGVTGILTGDDFAGDGRPGILEPIGQSFTGTDGADILTGNDGNNWMSGGAGPALWPRSLAGRRPRDRGGTRAGDQASPPG